MSGLVERRLFLHAETDKAVLVSPTCLRLEAEAKGAWLPRSQIVITARETIKQEGGLGQLYGTAITFTAPDWLLESRKLTTDLELPTTERTAT